MYFRELRIEDLLTVSGVIVFDMNGLLIDDELIQLEAVNIALSTFNCAIEGAYWEENCVGRSAEEFIQIFLENNLKRPLPQLEKIIRDKEKAYENLLRQSLPGILRKGAVALVEHINRCRRGRKLALATSSSRNNVDLLLGLDGFSSKDDFDLILCGDELTRAKPDPEIYLKVRDFFKNESVFLVFEDSAFGVSAAKRANLQCIAVPNHFTIYQDFTTADLVISDLTQDAKIIEIR